MPTRRLCFQPFCRSTTRHSNWICPDLLDLLVLMDLLSTTYYVSIAFTSRLGVMAVDPLCPHSMWCANMDVPRQGCLLEMPFKGRRWASGVPGGSNSNSIHRSEYSVTVGSGLYRHRFFLMPGRGVRGQNEHPEVTFIMTFPFSRLLEDRLDRYRPILLQGTSSRYIESYAAKRHGTWKRPPVAC